MASAPTTALTWHALKREGTGPSARVVIGSTPHLTPPARGVCVASEAVPNGVGGQETREHLAVNGQVRAPITCYHGQDRHRAWLVAVRAFEGLTSKRPRTRA